MTRNISENGLNLIKKWEGCRLKVYQDPTGHWTIGYGHTSGIKEGDTITQEQADDYLRSDVQTAVNAVNRIVADYYYEFTQNQFDALVSFTFNCGSNNLRKLTQWGDRSIAEIGDAIVLYNKSSGKVLQGLVNRRNDEQALYNTPDFAPPFVSPEEDKPVLSLDALEELDGYILNILTDLTEVHEALQRAMN